MAAHDRTHRSGRQADALHAYHRARQLLIEQLGIEPGAELQKLQRAILQQRADSTDIVLPPPAPGRRRITRESPMLAGRERELDEIRTFLAQPAGLLLLCGDPGIGKTRLLEEAQARHRGLTITSRAYEAERGHRTGRGWTRSARRGCRRSRPDCATASPRYSLSYRMSIPAWRTPPGSTTP